MDRFFKKSSSEAAHAKEEVEMLQEKVKTMGEVAGALEAQLTEKFKYNQLLTKTNTWKEKVKALTEADRARIAQLEAELGAFQVASRACGGQMPPEVCAAVQDSLSSMTTRHADELAAFKAQVESAQAVVATRDATIAELTQELEAVKAVHLETQQRFAEEMESITEHHEKEVAELHRELSALSELQALKARVQEQQSEIASLENHSLHQGQIMNVLQKDLAASTAQNELLSTQVRSLQESLATMEQKQSVWKEKVMQMKAKDNETIKQLQTELATSREASLETSHAHHVHHESPYGDATNGTADAAAQEPPDRVAAAAPTSPPHEQVHQLQIQLEEERMTHRQFEDKLQAWKNKAKQIKLQDMQTIQDLQEECHQLKEALERAQAAGNHTAPPETAHIAVDPSASAPIEAPPHQTPTHSATTTPEDKLHRVTDELHARTSELEQLQGRLATWKEKVKAAKAQDTAQIQALELQLDELRAQLSAGADEQAQANAALREQLDAAQAERDAAAQEAGQRAEDLAGKASELEQLEGRLAAWKEKVKAAKVADEERISAVGERLSQFEKAAGELRLALTPLLGVPEENTAPSDSDLQEWGPDLRGALSELEDGFVALAKLIEVSYDVGHGTAVMTSACSRLRSSMEEGAAAAAEVEALKADVAVLQRTEAAHKARSDEAEERAASAKEDLARVTSEAQRASALEKENEDLRTRCDLLRKELQRQREAAQRDRASTADAAAAEAVASPTIIENTSAAQTMVRAAAGGLSERDTVALGSSGMVGDGLLRSNRAKMEQLVKKNDELKRQNTHNNAVIAQYIREVEGYKANTRVQLSIEYLRNIVQQYLCAAEDLRPKMIPAICTVLEFNNRQKEDVQLANPRCPRFH